MSSRPYIGSRLRFPFYMTRGRRHYSIPSGGHQIDFRCKVLGLLYLGWAQICTWLRESSIICRFSTRMIYGSYLFVVVLLLSISADAFQTNVHKQTLVSLRGGLRINDSSSGIGWNSHKVWVSKIVVTSLFSQAKFMCSSIQLSHICSDAYEFDRQLMIFLILYAKPLMVTIV